MRTVPLMIDVTKAAGLGEQATVAVTVTLPEPERLGERPVVCFAKPGGGYSTVYFTEDLPGPGRGAQATWHAGRGWIVVAVDHLGSGASSLLLERSVDLTFPVVAAASMAAEQEVLERLAAGTLADGFPAVRDPLRIGIGQSLGGCMTIIQQGRYACYDGIGVLGYSAVWNHPPAEPGHPAYPAPWYPRDLPVTDAPINAAALGRTAAALAASGDELPLAWGFHYSDVDRSLIESDMDDFPTRRGNLPPWASAAVPGTAGILTLTPGTVAPEAAVIESPVLVAYGERDVSADPKGEPRAYHSSRSVDLFVCPRMGHMHNFASTRELLWQRIDTWAAWVRALAA